MERKMRVGVVFIFGLVMLYSSLTVAREAKDPNIYVGPPNRSSNPVSDPCFAPAPNSVVSLGAGEIISIGLMNEYDIDYLKVVHIILIGEGVDDVDVNGAVGMDNNGNSVSATRGNKQNISDESALWVCAFAPQPEYEIFRVANNGGDCDLVAIAYSCCYKIGADDPEKQKEVTYGTTIQQGTGGTVEVNDVTIFHEVKTIDANITGEFIPPDVNDPNAESDPNDPNTPTGTWTAELITEDPETGAPLPQNGWSFKCGSADRGIWEGELFEFTVSTTTLAGGNYWLLAHDRQRDEWLRFMLTSEEIKYLSSDINEDSYTDFVDVSMLAQQWLKKAPVYED